tara:strand:- start:13178 stop:13432 length:255 start_codon:yes stop_codon:yes gene_type:complete
MPQKIKPRNVTYVQGRDGEVKLQIDHQIDLNLTINLDSAGGIKVNVTGKYAEEENYDEDKVEWMVPDFGSGGLEDFGQQIKQEE